MNKTPSPRSRASKSLLQRKDNTTSVQSDTEQNTARIDDATRQAMIAEAAYYRAERRGFAPGFEVDDWLLSENELEAQMLTQIRQQSLGKSISSSTELH